MSSRILGALLFALTLSSCSGEQEGPSRSGSASSHAPRPPSFFYRMKADFILKETDETVQFDYVAACGGVVQNYSYTTPSVFYTHHPIIMFQPVGEGQALGLVTIDMCDNWKWGKVEFGPRAGKSRIPDDLRPLAIWFDDIDDLSRGWGYKTDDAYESPLAKMKFVSASVSVTDKSDWEKWRAEAEASYEQIGVLPGPWGYSYTNEEMRSRAKAAHEGGLGIVSPQCTSVFRVKIHKDVADAIFAKSTDDIGRYWFTTESAKIALDETTKLFSRDGPLQDGHSYRDYVSGGKQYSGTLRRSGGGYIIPMGETADNAKGFAYRDVYPFQTRSLAMPAVEMAQDTYYQKVLLYPEYLGFGACSSSLNPIDSLQRTSPWLRGTERQYDAPFDPEGLSKRHVLMVGDIPVEGVPRSTYFAQDPPNIIDREGFLLGPDH
ncbi:hypothetical protein [Hyphomonas oceanitis]|uniref:Lipoprotein n=1 Tax=Hyphomonas oceanitis SCH89 TaxID=1280953 RepID=A0A059G5U9_9PROT|nr:hypothetical protein [Hyphomonas oceanitis]KDA02109.1 hypothetical protein HOC_12017 [Hyphomonas oceanitis SCH89]